MTMACAMVCAIGSTHLTDVECVCHVVDSPRGSDVRPDKMHEFIDFYWWLFVPDHRRESLKTLFDLYNGYYRCSGDYNKAKTGILRKFICHFNEFDLYGRELWDGIRSRNKYMLSYYH